MIGACPDRRSRSYRDPVGALNPSFPFDLQRSAVNLFCLARPRTTARATQVTSCSHRCKVAPLFSITSTMLLPQPLSFQFFASLSGVYPHGRRRFNNSILLPIIPFVFMLLRTLLQVFALAQKPTLLFLSHSALFAKNTRGGYGGSLQNRSARKAPSPEFRAAYLLARGWPCPSAAPAGARALGRRAIRARKGESREGPQRGR